MGNLFSYPAMPDITTYDVILIGCSIDDAEKNAKFRSKEFQPSKTERKMNLSTKEEKIKLLYGLNKDLENMTSFFRSKGVRSITTIKPTGERCSEMIHQLKTQSHNQNRIIYYTGHGREGDGAWCIHNSASDSVSYITPTDLLHNSKSPWESFFTALSFEGEKPVYGETGNLVIIMDSCFAGEWIEGLFRYRTAVAHQITILASSKYYQVSTATTLGSWFTCKLLRENGFTENIPDLSHIKTEQIPIYHLQFSSPVVIPIGQNRSVDPDYKDEL